MSGRALEGVRERSGKTREIEVRTRKERHGW